jgi:threonine/homoserine/homoserine lactone efflux protein
MQWEALAPLLLTSLAVMGTPGPATISLTAVGSSFGVRRSLPYLAGIVAGTTIVLLAVATGITAALLAVPAMHVVLLAVSVAYILWLAYHVATAPPLSAQSSSSDAPSLEGGLLLGAANPKAWLAIAAVFAAAELADAASVDAAAKVAVLTVMIVVINAGWLIAGASLAPLLREPRRARMINIALAITLVGATAYATVP